MLARFYDPTAGRILVDGTDLRDASLESLSHQMGIVFQDSFRFHVSVRENLLHARPEPQQHLASADDRIRTLEAPKEAFRLRHCSGWIPL